ncbi:MAG: hypothetical protein AVDCRST_MAG20-1328, partial [uncultured Acidimicrobiales bacterium]
GERDHRGGGHRRGDGRGAPPPRTGALHGAVRPRPRHAGGGGGQLPGDPQRRVPGAVDRRRRARRRAAPHRGPPRGRGRADPPPSGGAEGRHRPPSVVLRRARSGRARAGPLTGGAVDVRRRLRDGQPDLLRRGPGGRRVAPGRDRGRRPAAAHQGRPRRPRLGGLRIRVRLGGGLLRAQHPRAPGRAHPRRRRARRRPAHRAHGRGAGGHGGADDRGDRAAAARHQEDPGRVVPARSGRGARPGGDLRHI